MTNYCEVCFVVFDGLTVFGDATVEDMDNLEGSCCYTCSQSISRPERDNLGQGLSDHRGMMKERKKMYL